MRFLNTSFSSTSIFITKSFLLYLNADLKFLKSSISFLRNPASFYLHWQEHIRTSLIGLFVVLYDIYDGIIEEPPGDIIRLDIREALIADPNLCFFPVVIAPAEGAKVSSATLIGD